MQTLTGYETKRLKNPGIILAGKASIALLLLFAVGVKAQNNPTLNRKDQDKETSGGHKVMIVPFEPRLYMSEIDRYVNAETKLSAKDIKFKFRDGINEQISKALRASKFAVLDLMDDTLKYRKDLSHIYQYLSYDYLRVPDQAKYKVPAREKELKKIEKGQVVVETNGDKRFMDAKVNDPNLLKQLNAKYRTDLFLFINQLDIKASGSTESGQVGEGNPNRNIIVHYTIFDLSGKEINSGTVEEDFAPDLNVPRKIVDKHFSKLAATLQQRLQKTLLSK